MYDHNHHVAHSYDPGYPPEYDDPEFCGVCGGYVDNTCDCPACPKCESVGDPMCYDQGHMPPAKDSIASLLEYEGCGNTLSELFHAINKHSSPSYTLHIKLKDGAVYSSSSLSNREPADRLPMFCRIHAVGVSGIAWDNSDWEFYEKAPASEGFDVVLPRLLDAFEDALAEHTAMYAEEEWF